MSLKNLKSLYDRHTYNSLGNTPENSTPSDGMYFTDKGTNDSPFITRGGGGDHMVDLLTKVVYSRNSDTSYNPSPNQNSNSDYQDLLKIIPIDDLHEQTHNINKAEGEAFKEFAIQVAKESGLVQQEESLEKVKTYPALVEAMFNNNDNEDDVFALKLALFEVEKIRESKNTALKTELRKAKSKIEVLRFAFDIVE